jgi:energy-coupling factor transporter ATP-binding protein EcfA2
MLLQLRLENFRCFKDHNVIFNPTTVVVGRNNAGKSTLIQALELLSLIINRKGGGFVKPPTWISESRFRVCVSCHTSELELNRDTLFHRYGEPPARITAKFTEGATVKVYIGKGERIFATLETEERWISTTAQFLALQLPWIYTLPQIKHCVETKTACIFLV